MQKARMNKLNEPNRILITGASGLIGQALSLALIKKGWQVVILGRGSEEHFRSSFTLPCEYHQWAEPARYAPPEASLNVQCVVNLMGESIANGRWSQEQKRKLRDSRILSTKNLVNALKKYNPTLKTFVSSSATGYYGEAGDNVLSEKNHASNDFLGTLCKDWEAEAQKAPGRCVQIRTGVVLSIDGGALSKMLPIFENGLGSRLASGSQWMSWIHIEDLVNVYLSAIENDEFEGAYNAVSPEPVTNSDFTKSLAKELKVGVFIPVPKIALQLALGEMSQILLSSQKVIPKALESQKFTFKYRSLELALKEIFNWKENKGDRIFQSMQWVSHSKENVFPFFSEVKNLEALTPDFLNFHVVGKSTENIQTGTLIDYKLKIHGVPVKWKTEICDWNPGKKFRDVQIKGPYSKWDHTHDFEGLVGGTLLTDKVIYRLPLASFGGNLILFVVESDIKKIFSFRKDKIKKLFGSSGANS